MLASSRPTRRRPDDARAHVGRAQRRALSRRRILDAASAALTEGDDTRFTVRDIAARANVSPGLVMQHFGSMADLVLEVFMEANADLDVQLAAAAGGADPRARTLAAFRWLMQRDLDRPLLSGRMMAFAWTWSGTQEERFQEGVQALTRRLVQLLDDPARATPASAREAAATALIAIYNVNLRRAVTAGYSADEAMKRMTASFDVVLDGLAAQVKKSV
jgi:AcrR family transcriptional regulator